jgi:hypothetical protein
MRHDPLRPTKKYLEAELAMPQIKTPLVYETDIVEIITNQYPAGPNQRMTWKHGCGAYRRSLTLVINSR